VITFLKQHLHYGLLGLALLICVGWHVVLFQTPTDTMTGLVNIRAGSYELRYLAAPAARAANDGVSTYRAIQRVDTRQITEWLARAFSPVPMWESSWQAGDRHQYLVERRDGDGIRVINTTLTLPSLADLLQYLGLPALATLTTLLAAISIAMQQPQRPIVLPLILLAVGTLINLAWWSFAVPFSYIALQYPFLIQLTLHGLGTALMIGTGVHIALVFPTPLAWYTRHRPLVLMFIYGLFPIGLWLIITFNPSLPDRLTSSFWWEQQATIALKAAAYVAWANQYRKASISQRGQLHWILMATTAFDLLYMARVFSDSNDLLLPYLWLSVLLPLAYIMATLPGRSLRLSFEATSGFVHGVANTLTLALFLCGFGLAAEILFVSGNQTNLPITTVLLSIIFALTTIPLANALRDQFDSWLHGTRSAQRALLHQFTGKVSHSITLAEVTSAFQAALDEGIQPSSMALWVWNEEAHALQTVTSSIVDRRFSTIDKALHNQLLALQGFVPAHEFPQWDGAQRYHGLISLVASNQLVGVCTIGARIDGRRYSTDTISFFETLARSATLALRNAQLVSHLEDNIAALHYAYHQLITVQENERQHLATELHDETLQQLAHANLLAGSLQPFLEPTAKGSLKELQSMLVTSERHLRDILRGLHPAVLTDLGLVPALNSWLPRSAGVSVKLTTAGFDGVRLPDPMLELTLYRLAQESVNNAIKHANAHSIDIRLTQSNGLITLEVTDDGDGFEPAALASKYRAEGGHFGLMNLRERVRALNGQLVIESKPQLGTTIRAVLPIILKEKGSP
jgi:signal transduction histidine kinase